MASSISPAPPDLLPPLPPRGTFLGHPKGLFLLFTVEMWERFSYYGMRGLLVLYLTAALAAHQLGTGTYSNTLRVQISNVPTDEEEKAGTEPPKTEILLPLNVVVGESAGDPTIGEPVASTGPLKIERLVQKPDPAHPGQFTWEQTAGSLGPPTFSVKHGERPTAEAIRYRVTNASDRKVKLALKLLRPYPESVLQEMVAKARTEAADDVQKQSQAKGGTASADAIAKAQAEAEQETRSKDNPEYKVYFKFNDSTSVVSTNITPESKRDLADDAFELTLDINGIDSGRSWLKAVAGTLYGWYTGMAYLLPILGGLIADKLIGTHRSMVVGALLITLGHLMLGVSGLGDLHMSKEGMTVFVFGLALITIGTGHFKPSVSVMVGQLYPLTDPRRESAFSIFYMGINLGAFLCNIVCGTLAVKYGWHFGFGAAAAGMIAGLLTYLRYRPKYLEGIGETSSGHEKKAAIFLPLGILAAAGVAVLFYQGVLGRVDMFFGQTWVLIALVAGALVYAAWFIAKQEEGDRGPVATIFIYMLFNAVFWLSFEQAGSSLTTFTDELTDRRLGFIWDKVPTAQFQSINPLLIILFAPIFGVFWAALARRKKSIGQPFKIGIGLIFVGLGYVVMFLAAQRLNTGVAKVGMMYISGCYFLHTVGEIILSPTGLAYVAKTAPKKHMSGLMGIWFISSFVAGLGAGLVSGVVDPIIEGKVTLPWHKLTGGGQADFFVLFVVSSVGAGLFVILLGAFLIKLQRNPTD